MGRRTANSTGGSTASQHRSNAALTTQQPWRPRSDAPAGVRGLGRTRRMSGAVHPSRAVVLRVVCWRRAREAGLLRHQHRSPVVRHVDGRGARATMRWQYIEVAARRCRCRRDCRRPRLWPSRCSSEADQLPVSTGVLPPPQPPPLPSVLTPRLRREHSTALAASRGGACGVGEEGC